MRKILLLILSFATFMYVAAADKTYGLCGEEFSGYGISESGTNYSAAIEVPEEVAAAMAGSTVTDVSIGFYSGVTKVANIFLTYDLDEDPFYEQQVKQLKAGKYNTYELDTPYKIEGKKFYIGYRYRASTSSGYPVGFDDANGAGNTAFSHLAVWNDRGTRTWEDGSQHGNLALKATISGDNFPAVSVIPYAITLSDQVYPGKEFTYQLHLRNMGTSPVSEVEVSSTVGDKDPVNKTITLASALAAGEDCVIDVTAKTNAETMNLFVKGSIEKVDGEANAWKGCTAGTTTICSNTVFQRIVVAEEYTGVDCGYCPRGIVALDHLNRDHPDTFLSIEVHNYSADPMYCTSYREWVNKWATGAPHMVMDRQVDFSPDGSTSEKYYQEHAGLVPYRVLLDVDYANEAKTELNVTAFTTFGATFENSENFALAFVITEDNLGPYYQSNYYSGGSTKLDGWESAGSYVSTMYDDVAREIFDWKGRSGTIPAGVTKGTYQYDTTLSISSSYNHDNISVTALLINQEDGSIMTAGRSKIGEMNGTSNVAVVSAINAKAIPSTGAIRLIGDFNTAEVFSMSGQVVARANTPGELSLNRGVYVVRFTSGDKTVVSKVMVR
jgi:hypothetical protein